LLTPRRCQSRPDQPESDEDNPSHTQLIHAHAPFGI
jgi:hypothetical protein